MDNVSLLIAGAGAIYLLLKNRGPVFRDMQGRAITEALCGSSATFDVPGYKQVWMSQLKDKQLHFDGPFNVPMPAYIFSCTNDIGVYDIAVYEIDANGQKGKLIGQTAFTVHAQQ